MVSAGGRILSALPGLAPTFLIVALLACVLVPLPTALVDLLLSLSLAGAVLLLVASLSIRRTTDFLSFPSLLLLATLYRLALNISTTRLILSEAYAGQVIEAFASFVIRGNLVVGGVMFAIITVIQYVVIARGAERVAEVAARFALDGLPGRQAAIDADLRAGVISPSEAARRRARLGERSSFYGAMDGAVRFVKGDAVAGLAIIGVNLLGGLAIGTTQYDLGWAESLQRYGRLTIGDGLLAQIPALLVSLAAGVLVSRVDREDESVGPGVRWLHPPMLVVPATMLLVLALVPSMPSLAFVTTAVGLLTGAVLLMVRSPPEAAPSLDGSDRRVTVRLHADDVEDPRDLERTLGELEARCTEALGIDVPPFELDLDRTQTRGRTDILLDDRLCARHAIEGDLEESVLVATFRAVMEHADQLIDLQDLDRGIEKVRSSHPVVVKQALEVVSLTDVLAVVRGFTKERIPLPPLRAILGVMAESHRFRDPAERPRFPEIVRQHLAGRWVHGVVAALGRWGRPRWVRLTPEAEDELLEVASYSEDGIMLGLTPSERARWQEQIATAGDELAKAQRESEERDEGPREPPIWASTQWDRRGPIVVLTTPKVRPIAALLVSGMVPHVPVLSTAELDIAGTKVEPHWLEP